MIRYIYWIWFVIGAVLLTTVGVPQKLLWSNGVFLLLYAMYTVDIVRRGWKRCIHLEHVAQQRAVSFQRFRKLATPVLLIWFLGMTVEWIGTATSWPFGAYTYASILGKQWYGVPLTIGFAWVAVVLNSALLTRRVSSAMSRALQTGGLAMAIDLVLDPVAHARGFWTWQSTGGFYCVPLANFIAWFMVASLLSLFLPCLPTDRASVCEAKWVYQSVILLFSLLALQTRLYVPVLIGLFLLLLVEGSWRRDLRRQAKVV